MNVVVDAGPLIAFGILERLDLIPALFNEVIVPATVYEEVVVRGAGYPGSSVLAHASWVSVREPRAQSVLDGLLLGLDPGEMSVLLVAREVSPDWVLMDERLGRQVAQVLGLRVKGTLGVLLAAYLSGLISHEDAVGSLDRLLAGGMRIARRVADWYRAELDIGHSEGRGRQSASGTQDGTQQL